MADGENAHIGGLLACDVVARAETSKLAFKAILDSISAMGFTRARIELASPDGRVLSVVAHSGFESAPPRETRVDADAEYEVLRREPVLQVYSSDTQRIDVPVMTLGALAGRVVIEGTARGALDDMERQLLATYASLAGCAEAMRQARSLHVLQETTLAIASIRDHDTLLDTIVEQAVKLLGAQSGGIYLFDADANELKVIADYEQADYVGKRLPKGEGLAGKLINSGKDYWYIDDYNTWEGGSPIYSGQRRYPAVVEVPLRVDGNDIGILYVDDHLGREFSELDARLLLGFASQATIALVTSHRLKTLARYTRETVGSPGAISLQDRLSAIASNARELLNAETAGLFLVSADGTEVVLHASVGQCEPFSPGKLRRRIHDNSVPGAGLTGYIAHTGKPFIAHGAELTEHSAVSSSSDSHTPSGRCYSLIAFPLIAHNRHNKHRVIGVVRADNKRSPLGVAGPELGFTQEDQWMLALFGETAVAAIENAELVEFQKRLISSSPDGIIAVDRKGFVTEFNERAEELLEYSADDVLNRPVHSLYDDKDEAYAIGQKLRELEGNPLRHESAVRTSSGLRIPIQHSASNLFDANREWIGSVGYFQDLRPLKHRLEVLRQISEHSQGMDPERLYIAILTGVTANYGLGFNRAMLLMVDEIAGEIAGQEAIGEIEDLLARRAWEKEVEDFDTFVRRLNAGEVGPTALSAPAKGLRFPIGDARVFSEIISQGKDARAIIISREQLSRVPPTFVKTLQITSSIAVAPLVVRDRVIALLVVDNKFNQRQIEPTDLDGLTAVASTAAVALANNRLLEHARSGAEKLLSFYELSGKLVDLATPREVAAAIVQEVQRTAGASWVSVFLIDRVGGVHNPMNWPRRPGVPPRDERLIRKDGISVKVMTTGQAFVIENVHARDDLNSSMIAHGVGAALCLPLSLAGRTIGVVWIHYDEPRRFARFEIAALQLYVNQAAIAFDARVRVDRLEALRRASDDLADITESQSVGQKVVDAARTALRADAVVLWSYDAEQASFIHARSFSSGCDQRAWEEYQKVGPASGGTAYRILHGIRMEVVEDIDSHGPENRLGERTRTFLRENHGKAFMGLPLAIGYEEFGVLFAIYSEARAFEEEERAVAEAFANRAALALKNERLLDQVHRAKQAADSMASVALLEESGDRDWILKRLAIEVMKGTECGAVTLFEYDRKTATVRHPPAMQGVMNELRLIEEDQSDYDLVRQVLEFDSPVFVENVRDEALFKNRRFVAAEQIQSCVGIPLRAAGNKLGVMFLSYRTPQPFSRDQRANIALYANQVAGVIRSRQLFEDLTTKLRHQNALVQLSKELIGLKTVQETLDRAVAVAASVFNVTFSNIVLPDAMERLIFKAAVGWEPEYVRGDTVMPPGRGSQTGYTVQQQAPVAVFDYSNEERFEVPQIVHDHGIRSGLSVPMFRNDQVVGAILVHSTTLRQFTEDDKDLLSLIANETAIAIESARQQEMSSRRSRYLQCLYDASTVITAQFGADRRNMLDEITKLAVHGISIGPKPTWTVGTLETYLDATGELELESAFPAAHYDDLVARYGTRRRIRKRAAGEALGITGRVIQYRSTQLAHDTRLDPDYLDAYSTTRSELAVPLRDEGKVIGVLNVESDKIGAFDEEDVAALEGLAELAVLAIRSARQFDELTHTRVEVDVRTQLALMGMGAAIQRHDFNNFVGFVRGSVVDLEKELREFESQGIQIDKATARTASISKESRRVHEALKDGLDDRRRSVAINTELLRPWQADYAEHQHCKVKLDLKLDDRATTYANESWLRAILDILANNAVTATKPKTRRIVVGSRKNKGVAEVYVADNGTGIPNELKQRLLTEPIPKVDGTSGLGFGLLLANTIVRDYGGTMTIEDNKPKGTIVTVSLPLERVTTRRRAE